jgi:hypothetical protein
MSSQAHHVLARFGGDHAFQSDVAVLDNDSKAISRQPSKTETAISDFCRYRRVRLLACGAASATGCKRRVRSRMQNIPVEEEVRERRAGLGKFGMRVKFVRNTGECV